MNTDHSKFKRLPGKTRMDAAVYASLEPLSYETKDLIQNLGMNELLCLTQIKEQS